jgi:hypothetical protein
MDGNGSPAPQKNGGKWEDYFLTVLEFAQTKFLLL